MGEDESKSRNLKGKILVSMQSIESYILTHPRLEMIEPSIVGSFDSSLSTSAWPVPYRAQVCPKLKIQKEVGKETNQTGNGPISTSCSSLLSLHENLMRDKSSML